MKELAFQFPGGQIDPVAGMPSGGVETFGRILRVGLTILFITITLAALIFFIWGGIQWITSTGDKTKIEAARKRLVYAVIGLIVAFSSYFIISLVGYFFNIKLLDVPTPVAPRCGDGHTGTCPGDKICTYSEDIPHYSCRRPCVPGAGGPCPE
ncbi:MAG: hypothetical protein HY426_02725 [Candidatus Levybacteria bacterium]|nr:hypothetical protein [Candidatus Levybacteria bacterium]MBI4097931.1 hypothetical protein [Candidatus Levybacteria bacterium]